MNKIEHYGEILREIWNRIMRSIRNSHKPKVQYYQMISKLDHNVIFKKEVGITIKSKETSSKLASYPAMK